MKLRSYALCMLLYTLTITPLEHLTIVIIIDQCSHTALQQTAPFLSGGIQELLRKGVIYDNAHFPYARTSTGPGHATLNTGTLPKDHGIVANYWYNSAGKKIPCDYDCADNAAILSPTGYYKKSRSALHLKVDGISDQMILESNDDKKNIAYCLSLKSRAAIYSAGRLGKAIFFDSKAGQFTSSKAYFDELPTWIKTFNHNQEILKQTNIPWRLCYPNKKSAYSMTNKNYSYARLPTSIGKDLTHDFIKKDTHKDHHCYNYITYSPQSNKLLLDLAIECLKNSLEENPHKMLLWISLSSLDKIGHLYGPNSAEYIDTIYHIDQYLKDFMQTVKSILPEEKILYALTADHGSTPMVECLQEKNFSLAHRILTPKLEEKMNKKIEKKYGISVCIKEIDNPSIFLDHTKIKNLSLKDKKNLLYELKQYLKKQPGIKNVWTHEELNNATALPDDFTQYYKNQLFHGRTGSLIYQTYPYTYVSDDPLGTGHVSCYEYTTHVPLIFYKAGTTKPKTFKRRISMAQFAPTLADELSIPHPSACVENALRLR